MGKKKQRRYFRLTKAERCAIERGLDRRESCRSIARSLGRSPSTVADEVARNRTVSKGPGKGERAGDAPEDACPRLLSWPRACNGCNKRRYHCSRPWRCEYSAARAQALADEGLSRARRGVDRMCFVKFCFWKRARFSFGSRHETFSGLGMGTPLAS